MAVALGWLGAAGGCFPPGSGNSDGGYVGYSGPTLEVTAGGVHFGPAAPDPGAYADLVVMRDATGTPMGGSFRLSASIGTAGCTLAFDRYGRGVGFAAGQYTVQSMQGSFTLDGTVYPTTGELFTLPGGNARCTGSDCDGAAFVLTAADAQHATGYFRAIVSADSGAGQAEAVCSFWVKMRTYTP